jgi:UDP-3-O-acyl-N-acetylglucosamine deacetylase
MSLLHKLLDLVGDLALTGFRLRLMCWQRVRVTEVNIAFAEK